MARKLAIWFHKSFGGDRQFKAGAFVPPPEPRETERELHEELERLRTALVTTQEQIAGNQQLVAEHAQQRQEAEAAARRAYDDLTAALELAAETEQQLKQERQQFQHRLAELQAQAETAPAAQRAIVVELAQQEAEALDLDEAQTRHIIDKQLREAGWEADTQILTYASGTRPVQGRNLALAEWPTANGPADYVLFVGLTPAAMVEAKRRRTDVAGAIEQAKRYSRGYTVGIDQQSPGGPWGAYTVPFLFATNAGGRFCARLLRKAASGSSMPARTPPTHASSKPGIPPRGYPSFDRTALGEQAADKLKDVRLENLQTFPDIYDVKELGDLRPESDIRLHIATVQGMIKRLVYPSDEIQPVPVDWYDCVIVDECHRGYTLDQEMSDAELQFRSEADYISKYRRVIDHFDAVHIGLTATSALHTTEIFGPPIFEYSYRQAVIDDWLVDHEPPYRLVTRLAEEGMRGERGDAMKTYDTHSGTFSTRMSNCPK
jgi:hypothetical protein